MEFIRSKKVSLSLDMAPLIDVVFQLLIFFMLSSSFLNPALKLDLPKAVRHDSLGHEQIAISIDKTGTIFLNTQPVSMDRLKSQLEARLANQKGKAVHLRGDEEMPYRLFVEVMDIARQAGARQINIVHQSKQAA